MYIPLFDILFGSQSTSGLPGCVPPCPLVSSLVLLCPPMSPVVSWCPRMSPHCWDTCPRVSPQVPPCPRTAGTHVPACPRRSLHVPARAGTRVPQCPSVSPGVPWCPPPSPGTLPNTIFLNVAMGHILLAIERYMQSHFEHQKVSLISLQKPMANTSWSTKSCSLKSSLCTLLENFDALVNMKLSTAA